MKIRLLYTKVLYFEYVNFYNEVADILQRKDSATNQKQICEKNTLDMGDFTCHRNYIKVIISMHILYMRLF